MNWTKESLKSKKATINMKCNDEESFKWAVTRALNPIDRNADRVTKILREQAEKYNWEGLDFPTPIEQIETFEKNNDLLVNVFGFDEEKGFVRTLKTFDGEHSKRVLLMVIDDQYLVVKSVSRLLCGQFTKKHGKRFYCNNCLKGFPSEGKLSRHVESKCGTEKPKVVCELCSRERRGVCPLHLDLSRVSGSRLVYLKESRKDILDPERIGDIFLDYGGDIYRTVLEGDEWTYVYMGESENVRIVGLDEDGEMVETKHVCEGCVAGGVCKCSTESGDCDLCRRQGRDLCALHMELTDPNGVGHPADYLSMILNVVGGLSPIEVCNGGERYEVVFKGGRWVHSYVGDI